MPSPRKPQRLSRHESALRLLRPTLLLREVVHTWMTTPGIVEKMMGPPLYPDNSIPSFREFCADWEDHIWTHAESERGRMFLAAAEGELVGCIAHNDIVVTASGDRATELDLWLARPDLVGRFYGRRAIAALCDRVGSELGVEEAFLQPSARNEIACRSYAGAGFQRSPLLTPDAARHYRTSPDYPDSVFFVKRLGAKASPAVAAAIQSR